MDKVELRRNSGAIMIDLTLREEFRGRRLKGTTVDFTNQAHTGALDIPSADFLRLERLGYQVSLQPSAL